MKILLVMLCHIYQNLLLLAKSVVASVIYVMEQAGELVLDAMVTLAWVVYDVNHWASCLVQSIMVEEENKVTL